MKTPSRAGRPRWPIVAWLASTWLWGASAPAVAEAPPAATLSIDAVRHGVAEARARLRSLEVEMLVRSRRPGTLDWEPTTLRRVVAARGPCRFVESSHFNGDFPEALDIEHNAIYFDGRTLVNSHPAIGLCEVTGQRTDRFDWKVRCELVLECLGWWPPDDPSTPPNPELRWFLHDALADPACRVRPERQAVDGAWCHVVERPGVDTFWIDPAIGFALRRRERAPRPPARGLEVYALSEFREVAPGLWLPGRIRQAGYAAGIPAGSRAARRLVGEVDARVVRVAVNRVPEGRFRFDPPPGTLVKDADSRAVTQVPGGIEFLDSVAALAAGRLAAYERLGRPAGGRDAALGNMLASVALFVAASLVVGVGFAVKVPRLRRAAGRGTGLPHGTPS